MTEFVVGAYAAQPADEQGQREFYDLLADTGWVTGLEVPFPGQMESNPEFIGSLLEGRFTHSVLTAIPGTMVNVWDDPDFGLGSPDAAGRKKAVDFTAKLRNTLEEIHTRHGHCFDWVALHSAPTNRSTAEVFADTLAELKEWEWCGAKLVIEHCDEATTEHTPEKGFLHLPDEIAVAQQLGLNVSLNWGRSAVGSRGDVVPNQHIAQAAESGVLAGVIFSGASPEETIYGPVWIDGHLPCSVDEPASLMTPQQIKDGVNALGSTEVAYLGAKCCVPKDAPLERRVEMFANIYRNTVRS